MAGTNREISSVMTSTANNYNTRLDSSVRIRTRIRIEFTQSRNTDLIIENLTDSDLESKAGT